MSTSGNNSHDPERIARDLRKRVRGEVLFDDVHRHLYSTAACIFQMTPMGVVVPEHTEDVQAVVRFAREKGIPVTARGAGSGLAGQTLSDGGIVIDFSKHMDEVLEVNQVQSWVRVQPGVVLGDLNRKLARYGLWFPPDPSSGDVATIGGMIANNASGAHTVKYGPTRDYILESELVLDSGDVVTVKREPRTAPHEARHQEIVSALGEVLRSGTKLLQDNRPDVPKNSSGYWLWDVLRNEELDLNRLIAGSEGTLGIVTEAKLKVIRRPAERALIRFLFDSPEAACRAVLAVLPIGPSAVELVDKTIVDLVKGTVIEQKESLHPRTQSILLVEFDGQTRPQAIKGAKEAIRKVKCLESKLATGGDYQDLWKIRKAASPILDRMEGNLKSTRIIEDVCVNPRLLPRYLKGLRGLFARHGVDGIIFGHAGSGHVHVNLLMNPDDREDYEKMGRIAADLSELVARLDGTLSGEHGDGVLRAPYMRTTYRELYPLFEEVKRIFDPAGILNPGKILCDEDYDFRKDLRGSRRPDQHLPAGSPFARWQEEIEKCNGCGHCRTYCPVFKVLPDEAATPRAKANLLMGVLEEKLDLEEVLDSGELRDVADQCINCKLCLIHCPTGVDIPGMSLEAKTLDTQRHGLSGRDRMFADARRSSERAARWAPIANFLLGNPLFRGALRLFRGIASKRRFPKFGTDRTTPTARPDAPRVVYVPGCSADFNDPGGERRATVEILEKNGFQVVIPEGLCCGLPAHSMGARMMARDDALGVVNALSRHVEEGVPIVTSATSCGYMIRREYPDLLRTGKADRVAAATRDIHEFLMDRHREGRLDVAFKRINATCIFHATCHQQAIGSDAAARELLGLIPMLQLLDAPSGCCGMAGSFGFKSETYDTSVGIARLLTDDMRRQNPGFLVTSNGNCRIQLSEAAGRTVLHTMTLLHKAYGLSPLKGIHSEHEGVAISAIAGHMQGSKGGR